jgi:hypothetical protein
MAMWTIAVGILAATAAVLVADGIEGYPYEWLGLGVAGVLTAVAFALGLAD